MRDGTEKKPGRLERRLAVASERLEGATSGAFAVWRSVTDRGAELTFIALLKALLLIAGTVALGLYIPDVIAHVVSCRALVSANAGLAHTMRAHCVGATEHTDLCKHAQLTRAAEQDHSPDFACFLSAFTKHLNPCGSEGATCMYFVLAWLETLRDVILTLKRCALLAVAAACVVAVLRAARSFRPRSMPTAATDILGTSTPAAPPPAYATAQSYRARKVV
jgi:hypothetical protein